MSHANTILTWQENSMEDEMPPEWMWHLDHELTVWFERVDEARKERYGGGDSSKEDDSSNDMMTNELARGRSG